MEKPVPFNIDPVSNRLEILQMWRMQRAYRVGRTLCRVGIPLSLVTAIVDFQYSTWAVWAGDLLIAICCSISLWMSDKPNQENAKFYWLPAYFGYWISSVGTFSATGGVNSPFMALVLCVLYFCGVIVQNRIWHVYIFLFTLGNLFFWMIFEYFHPLSHLAAEQPPLFTGLILSLGTAILVTIVEEMMKTEKMLASEILDRYAELNEAHQSLEREEAANAAKTTFLANISHELRTPLNSIIGYTDLMKDPELSNDEKEEFVQTIQRNGRQLARLVDDLLDLSKIEAGKIEVEKIEFSTNQVLADVLETMTLLARKKNLELSVKFATPVPSRMISDPMRIKQILLNIIGNAIKFTDTGSVEVCVSHAETEIGKGVLKIQVLDTGRGLSDEEKQKLFKPFSQADVSMTRKYGGTGLGLNLSRRFAQLLGGDLDLSGRQTIAGSVCTLTAATLFDPQVEFLDQLVQSPKVVGPLETFEPPPSLERIRILVVDDIIDNQNLVRNYLHSTGAEIETAQDGLEGLQKAIANDFDIVLMDIQMPVLDGYQATQKLRAHGYQGSIIALTAHAMKEDLQKCLIAGCDDYLTKPLSQQTLIEKLQSQIDLLKTKKLLQVETRSTSLDVFS